MRSTAKSGYSLVAVLLEYYSPIILSQVVFSYCFFKPHNVRSGACHLFLNMLLSFHMNALACQWLQLRV